MKPALLGLDHSSRMSENGGARIPYQYIIHVIYDPLYYIMHLQKKLA